MCQILSRLRIPLLLMLLCRPSEAQQTLSRADSIAIVLSLRSFVANARRAWETRDASLLIPDSSSIPAVRTPTELFKSGRVTDKSVSEALRRSLDSAYGLEQLAVAKGIPIVEPFAGQSDESGCLVVLEPRRDYHESLLPDFRGTPEPIVSGLLGKALTSIREAVQRIAETWDFETLDDSGETSPENNSSAIVRLAYDGHSMLFTADAGIPALTLAADWAAGAGIALNQANFIQVPHHGSRRNVGPTILNRLVGPKRPGEQTVKSAFVSVAKDGDEKHPSKKVTNAFKRRNGHRNGPPDRRLQLLPTRTLAPMPQREVPDGTADTPERVCPTSTRRRSGPGRVVLIPV